MDSSRREPGDKNPNGITQMAIVRYFMLSEKDELSEPAIQDYVSQRDGDGEKPLITSRDTINKHLIKLRDKYKILELRPTPGKANIWNLSTTIDLPIYIYTHWHRFSQGFLDIYRSRIFQRELHSWYRLRCYKEIQSYKKIQSDPEEEEKKRFSGEYIVQAACTPVRVAGSNDPVITKDDLENDFEHLSKEALRLTPTTFFATVFPEDPATYETRLPEIILWSMTNASRYGESWSAPISWVPEKFFSIFIDLIVDFERYRSLQDDIVEFIKKTPFIQKLNELFDEEALCMISRSLSRLYGNQKNLSFNELEEFFDFVLPSDESAIS
jgi:hypothetical protein